MFNPLENEAVEEWFENFNARLRRLPAEERSQMQLEVRQHLEALAAANEKLGSSPEKAWEQALEQFGDPAKIGDRLLCEYQESRSGPYSGLIAVGFGMVLYLLWFGLHWLGFMMPTLLLRYQSSIWYSPPLNALFTHAFPLLIPFIIGRTYPFQAIKGAFYANVLMILVENGWFLFIVVSHPGIILPQPWPIMMAERLPLNIAWSLGFSMVAYLASVTKRGWYRPSLADFTLTLPNKRRQTNL